MQKINNSYFYPDAKRKSDINEITSLLKKLADNNWFNYCRDKSCNDNNPLYYLYNFPKGQYLSWSFYLHHPSWLYAFGININTNWHVLQKAQDEAGK